MTARHIALFLAMSGCTIVEVIDRNDGGSTTLADDTGSSTTFPAPTDATVTTTSRPTDDTSSDDGTSSPASDDGTETACNFLCDDPEEPEVPPCDVWNDDCPRGEKCTFWSNDGSPTLNATRCVPLVDDPAGPGDACTFEVSALSGFDNCDVGTTCWGLSEDPLTCVPFCVGSPRRPTCADANLRCSIAGSAIPSLCLPICNPLDQSTCPRGSGCFPVDGTVACIADASGPDAGAQFDTCAFTNTCDPGLACENAAFVGACADGAKQCCTPWCDLDAPACPEGLNCIPAYDQRGAPSSLASVGLCGLEGAPP
ncbi:MAG: hypothetical protein AAGA54_15770 [Myxococcota bacterium]